MNEDKNKIAKMEKESILDDTVLFKRVSAIIESRKYRARSAANAEITMMFWEIGRYMNDILLNGERAEYGKRIVSSLTKQLVPKYGSSFSTQNIRKMMRFSQNFSDIEIVSELAKHLSWTHFVELDSVKSDEARMFYARDIMERQYGVRELRKQISRKAFERQEIANSNLSEDTSVPFNVFKDPFLLDVLDLKENYLEADLEKAILNDIQNFILEFGHGFAFIESQKRMSVGDDDYVLDLLFFNRNLNRLVAVELKLGSFKPAYKGQMELYLAWLDQNERTEREDAPVGIILCASANRDAVEMLNMDKSGIAVAEYWTELPPQEMFQAKIAEIMDEAKERLERRKSLTVEEKKRIEYYFEAKDDDDEYY